MIPKVARMMRIAPFALVALAVIALTGCAGEEPTPAETGAVVEESTDAGSEDEFIGDCLNTNPAGGFTLVDALPAEFAAFVEPDCVYEMDRGFAGVYLDSQDPSIAESITALQADGWEDIGGGAWFKDNNSFTFSVSEPETPVGIPYGFPDTVGVVTVYVAGMM
jgi:hypothetical protein